MEGAWDIEQGDTSIVVAIIDSGLKLNHPEFAGRIWRNWAEVPSNGVDDDGNGFKDDLSGWDFANNDNAPLDDFGHGSNVTGIIGVNGNNGIGYAGVDWNCKLMILKGLDDTNSGFYSWWIEAIYYAVDNGAHVINMSLGGLSNSTTLRDAVEYAVSQNVVVVVSMMNGNTNAAAYPAVYNGVIAVGSTDPNDQRTAPFFWGSGSGSNFGNHISVVAPGNYIYGLSHESNTNYNLYWGGTSQSAPLVSGLAALLLAQDPNRTPAEIKSIIETSAEDQVGDDDDTPGWDQYYGHGRINAFNALVMTSVDYVFSNGNRSNPIYPNPTAGNFTIDIPEGVSHIQIFNSLGQLALHRDVVEKGVSDFHLDEPGVYFIQLVSGHTKTTQKIVVY
jgi:subtilisin family serine protease